MKEFLELTVYLTGMYFILLMVIITVMINGGKK